MNAKLLAKDSTKQLLSLGTKVLTMGTIPKRRYMSHIKESTRNAENGNIWRSAIMSILCSRWSPECQDSLLLHTSSVISPVSLLTPSLLKLKKKTYCGKLEKLNMLLLYILKWGFGAMCSDNLSLETEQPRILNLRRDTESKSPGTKRD